jgi:hypothetical protein
MAMSTTQLDQFIYAVTWKGGPVIILSALGALVLRQVIRRLGQRAVRDIRAPRVDRNPVKPPPCPSCDRPMVKRRLRRGFRAGSEYWGCSNYPVCTDTRSL